jgi:hypothetical protein
MIGLKGIKKGIEFQIVIVVKTHNEGSYLSIDRSFFLIVEVVKESLVDE